MKQNDPARQFRAASTSRENHIRAALALSLIPSVGAGRIRDLFDHFESPMEIFSADPSVLSSVSGIGPDITRKVAHFSDWQKVDKQIDWAEKNSITLLTPHDDAYPERLAHIYDPPALLWVKGSPEALKNSFLAVVGTRNPTRGGREMTANLTETLLKRIDIGIVSGLANGIDTIAHQITLNSEAVTVAVLAHGIDRVYPGNNYGLAQLIVQNGGALISEFPPGTKPEAWRFPIRNRIVSGMSLGVLVTETGESGGSMITVSQALDQGREVFTLPQDIRNPKGRGCNNIIRRGWGKLIRNVSDILQELPLITGDDDAPGLADRSIADENLIKMENSIGDKNRKLTGHEQQICKFLSGQTVHIDRLSRLLQIDSSRLLPLLLQLELEGHIIQKPGKNFTAAEW